MSIKRITKLGIVAAIYITLTYIFAPISYENIQFRISEILVLLVFYKKDYIIPLVLGTAIANIGSPLGIVDVGFGTLGTFLAVIGIYLVSLFKSKFKHQWIPLFIASLMPVIANGFIVGWELNVFASLPFWPSVIWVAIGETVVVSIVGVIIFSMLEKKQSFMDLIIYDNYKSNNN